jgi:ferredoxin
MIFYFSGTGNSKYAAKKLSEDVGGKLVNMADAVNSGEYSYRPEEGEDVGIVFPVYYSGIPATVRKFLSNVVLAGVRNPYVYAVATCGSKSGASNFIVKELLRKRDISLTAFYSVRMPSNYIVVYEMAAPDKIEKRLVQADKEIDLIEKHLRAHHAGTMDKHASTGGSHFAVPGKIMYDKMRGTAKFHVDDSCTKCGLCFRRCPDRAIAMTKNGPVWQKSKCDHCMACIHGCPESAIQYGDKTRDRGRYLNPNIDI